MRRYKTNNTSKLITTQIKMKQLLLTIVAATTLLSCTDRLISDEKTKTQVETRLNERDWLPQRTLETTGQEKEAMDFLYAYMPMGDAYDFDEELYLDNVKTALKTKTEMSWGERIPENVFLHFVLPVRINNEDLDTSREDFFQELKPRLAGMTMEEAILEVNHWCHEKATYVPADGRTSSSSAVVKSAHGRCGEESTFAVAALRAVGIPARQIYTPRWAHTDDNHAWVEAWADGTWHYIGACEPEPVLNCGWFDAPAKRGMLMFTKVFGNYEGSEDIINQTSSYTEINVTENYAPVKKQVTTIVDENGKPVEDATVHYTIFNYAQFYPAVSKTTDSKGQATFSSGIGDMIVHAVKDGVYGFAKLPASDTTLTVTLNRKEGQTYQTNFDITPPVSLPVNQDITEEMRNENNRLFAQEDSIRNSYVKTFFNEEQANKLASELNVDKKRLVKLMINARGNHADIKAFLSNTPNENRGVAMDLLEVITKKDLADTPENILTDHINGAIEYKDNAHFKNYILAPRIDNELIVAFRSYFNEKLGLDAINAKIASIKLRPELNPANLRITAIAVDKLGMADMDALERYAITLMRTNGIASRREPITEKPQYFADKKWNYITFPQIQNTVKEVAKGKLRVTLDRKSATKEPKFYKHFTIAKLVDGQWNVLDMSKSVAADMGEGLSHKTMFNAPLSLEVGTYQLLTGTRMADGSVAARSVVFNIKAGKTTHVNMLMRKNTTKLQVIGEFNPESMFIDNGKTTEQTLLSKTGRGYFVLALIDAKKEPTTHLLRGLESINKELTQWGRPVVLLLQNKERLGAFNINEFPTLPKTITYGYDSNKATWDMLHSKMKLNKNTPLPIVVVGDTFGRVVYLSTGYNTSVGEQLKNVIGELSNN